MKSCRGFLKTQTTLLYLPLVMGEFINRSYITKKSLSEFFLYVRPPGLEPGTISLKGCCSTD